MSGNNPREFSGVTFKEMQIIIDASSRRDARMAWLSAQYARFAYHEPNNMPDDPGEIREEGVNRQADVAYVRAWFKARAANGS